ncbi:hypothetical protein KIN20_032232 [Parelaphostrongylus tenuis]|uniref:Uncharacterized protein n=1 Tax=Parelaphostrongylus tenuis TaxID=148309 RepID=A0AAD5R6S2_PARTN|nr:hypothetical protein KIN20_032232 [Parelaphostrongylus tenuis]
MRTECSHLDWGFDSSQTSPAPYLRYRVDESLGTIVTPESFRIWKEKFDKERKALMEKKEKDHTTVTNCQVKHSAWSSKVLSVIKLYIVQDVDGN